MQVAPNTVVHAYDKLSQRELIHTQRGVGYYITPGAFESVLAQRRKVFHEETVPQFKRDARLLGITPDELRELLEL